MTTQTYSLPQLGWSADFQRQVDFDDDAGLVPARLSEVHRDRVQGLTETGTHELTMPRGLTTGEVAVGDWVLYDPETSQVARVLERTGVLSRRAAGTDVSDQLIAANVDTLFIVSSLNADFNPARLERYLALAHAAGSLPVLVLTKSDLCDDPDPYLDTLREIAPAVPAITLDARNPDEVAALTDWCGSGKLAAFLGSSGVGKSTLISLLTGRDLATQDIREDDAKGRHTTTERTLYAMPNGGWVIDTPGMRALRLHDVSDGIDTVFADLAELALSCKFTDCAHETEPGCAIRAAMEGGEVSEDRLHRWQKLLAEDARNAETLAEARRRDKAFGKMVKSAMKVKRRD